MRTSSSIRALVLLAVPALAAVPCPGQATATDPAPAETAAEWTPPEPTEAVKQMQQEFVNLHSSLRNSLGLQESDLGTVRDFRQRVTQRLGDDPGNPYLLAMRLQLSMWLKDDEAVDADFRSLLEITGDAARYGQPWANYFRGRGDVDRLSGIYETLIRMDPENETVRMSWAEQLKQEGRFDE
ncbi:MAG: tetratricopeptide repeat protein, partial [Planctomycetota bacterium]